MTVFAKGAWYALEDLCNTNYNVIGLDWLHDPAQAYAIARAKGKTVQGNADPGVLYGSRESITTTVEHMAKGFGGGKQGWIANLGHGKDASDFSMSIEGNIRTGITPFVDPEDLKWYFTEIHRCTSA
jgi:uroporphyrinogen decarboxylase